MARWVTVSAVSAPPWDLGPKPNLTRAAAIATNGWQQRLEAILPDEPDLILLSEFCDEPATDRPLDYYRLRGETVRDYFAEVARSNHCYIGYSAVRTGDNGRLRNSIQLLDRSGSVAGTYDKNHLTIEENEQLGITYGTDAPVFDLDFGRVACAICFDLNFDELRERYVGARPDLMLFSSVFHGSFLQTQWAYSCRAWLVAAVRPPARCGIISPVGELVASSTNYVNAITYRINLDRVVVHLDGNWERLAKHKRQFGRAVHIHDPGLLGSVLVTSECESISATQMAGEVKLELLDDYLARCRAHRATITGGRSVNNSPVTVRSCNEVEEN